MDILVSFKDHINSEKLVGTRFMLLGILLLIVAGYVFVGIGKTEFTSGLKWTSLVIGVLMVTSGVFYRNQSTAAFKEYTGVYQSNKQQFLAKEVERATALRTCWGIK